MCDLPLWEQWVVPLNGHLSSLLANCDHRKIVLCLIYFSIACYSTKQSTLVCQFSDSFPHLSCLLICFTFLKEHCAAKHEIGGVYNYQTTAGHSTAWIITVQYWFEGTVTLHATDGRPAHWGIDKPDYCDTTDGWCVQLCHISYAYSGHNGIQLLIVLSMVLWIMESHCSSRIWFGPRWTNLCLQPSSPHAHHLWCWFFVSCLLFLKSLMK